MTLEIGDVVQCIVDRIAGTVVFVRILDQIEEGGELEGSIILSEIAPGRIRNLRDYVVPKKRIICKVIRLSHGRIDLSLRRVTPKEKKETLEKAKQEKSYESIIKSVLGEKSNTLIEKIRLQSNIYDFLQETKTNPEILEKLTSKENTKKILDIINTQKRKTSTIKKEISLKTDAPNGLELIKNLLKNHTNKKGIKIRYLSAGKYTIQSESENIKEADNKIKEIASEIEKESKKKGVEFSIKDSKK